MNGIVLPAQGAYADRLFPVKRHEDVAALVQNVFLRVVQRVMVRFFHLPVRRNPFFIERLESGPVAGIVGNDGDIPAFPFLFCFFHPFQQRFFRQQAFPFFNGAPQVVPGLAGNLFHGSFHVGILFRHDIGHFLSLGGQHDEVSPSVRFVLLFFHQPPGAHLLDNVADGRV